MVNKRHTLWASMRDKILEKQAVFRKTYSTSDHIFTRYAVVQKNLLQHEQKLNVGFVEKAFDSLNQNKLWLCVPNTGQKG